MALSLVEIEPIPPRYPGVAAILGTPVWSTEHALRESAAGRRVMVKSGRRPALLVLEPGADAPRELPVEHFVEPSFAGLADVAVHPTRELAAVLAKDLHGPQIVLLDLETDAIVRRIRIEAGRSAVWLDDSHLVACGVPGAVVLEITDDDVRWVGTAKLSCQRLWSVAGGRVLVGLDGKQWRVAAVKDGRIGFPVRSTKWSVADDHASVEERDGFVIIRTDDRTWRLDGATDDVATFDPHAQIEKELKGLAKKKNETYGFARVDALRPASRQPVEVARPETQRAALEAWRMDDGRTVVRSVDYVEILDAGGAKAFETLCSGVVAVHPQPGCPSLVWAVSRDPEGAKKGVPHGRITAYDLSQGFLRTFNSYEVPFAEPRLHVHADALYADGGDVLLEIEGFAAMLAFYREAWAR
ncbi:MAG: hypothetical protein H6737_31190 [Alphaproteobacteria bacterium]|nr:hypothetical protein [Alphaproteobacteria bacterium]